MDGCTRTTHGLGLDLCLILLVEGALHVGGDGLEESGMTRKRRKKIHSEFYIRTTSRLKLLRVPSVATHQSGLFVFSVLDFH